MGSVSATPATSGTTATAPRRRPPASPATDRCAAGGAAVCAAAVSAPSRGLLETPVRNAPPAPTPAALKGDVYGTMLHLTGVTVLNDDEKLAPPSLIANAS